MCDCYMHKCELCDESVDMHIGDFRYPRTALKVWCAQHITKARPGAVLFTWDASEWDASGACAVLGPAVGGTGDNHPNVGGWGMTEQVIPGAPWRLVLKHALWRAYADLRHHIHMRTWSITWKLWRRRRWERELRGSSHEQP